MTIAGVATKANERSKLERLCRYITRPAVSKSKDSHIQAKFDAIHKPL
jgi:hypothetical protein